MNMRPFGCMREENCCNSTEKTSWHDFVSRFFVSGAGIDEDPVTGSAHCCLRTYWGKRIGKTSMTAHQVSKRGGVLKVITDGDRVII